MPLFRLWGYAQRVNAELLAIAGRGDVLVFPTEDAARTFSVSYALETGKGLLASSAVAFDRFAELFYPEADGRRPAGDSDRVIFSSWAATELSKSMRYFVSPAYPEVRERLQPYFKSMLQHLEEAHGASADAEADLALLKASYKGYLERLSLYESAYAEPVMPSLDREYYILLPSCFPKERKLVEFLSGKDHIHIVEAGKADFKAEVFESEIEELRDVFLHIRELLDEGVELSDIVITTAGADRLRYQLLEEAALFDIPIEFVAGSSPLSYPAGAFLSSLESVYTSRYSLSELKAFFLNPAFPFKERDKLRRFVRKAIDASISSAPSPQDDRYRRISDADGGDKYRLLRFALDLLMTEKNPSSVLPMLNQIMSGLLEPGEFNAREDDRDVYSFALRELTGFLSKLKASQAAGYGTGVAVFPLFMGYLKSANYVPRKRKGGVRVYSFSNDAAVFARHRFLLTLNEKDSKKTVKDAAFLSDYELSEKREARDITADLLYSYSLFSEKLYPSASYNTYQGFALPLTFLGQEKAGGGRLGKDPWERSGEAEGIYPLQKESYLKALASSLWSLDKEEDLTKALPGKRQDFPVPLDYSSVAAYVSCPFKYALTYHFGLSGNVAYDASMIDNAEIGTRLHSVMERFFREGGEAKETIPVFFEDEMRLWAEGKAHGRNGLVDMPSASLRPSPSLVAWIRKKYLDNLVKLAGELSSSFKPVENGLEASFKDIPAGGEDYTLRGRIDLLAREKEQGALTLIDYKKTLPKLSSAWDKDKPLQFHIYSLILEYSMGEAASGALFAGFNTGTTLPVDLGGMGKKELEDLLGKAAAGIAEGNWKVTDDPESCVRCAFRAVCRTRFTVR